MAKHEIFIRRAGSPIDLSLLGTLNLKEFFEHVNINSDSHNELENVRRILSIVLHENCSSYAHYTYNRSFFSEPTPENKFGYWDLRLGKALWRGFYSCLVLSKGTYQLLMNLDGKPSEKY